MLKLHNQLSNKIPALDRATQVALFDRLLWLRNHYDIGKPELKSEVLADIDALLDRTSGQRHRHAQG